jgi:hypothetical protein
MEERFRLTAHVCDLPNPKDFKGLRDSVGEAWFMYYRQGKVYALPTASSPSQPFGTLAKLKSTGNVALGLVGARLCSLLPTVFPQYEALYQRPFAFLGKKDELVHAALTKTGLRNPNALVRKFTIRPKFELDPHVLEMRDGEVAIALITATGGTSPWNCPPESSAALTHSAMSPSDWIHRTILPGGSSEAASGSAARSGCRRSRRYPRVGSEIWEASFLAIPT